MLPAVNPEPVPVMLVPTSAEGVPNAGVTRVGELDNTTDPVPVEVVVFVPPLATGSIPVTPEVKGNPVVLVNTPDDGVPSAGVTRVGDVANTTVEPVPVVVPAIIAVPFPANTGDVTVVDRVSAGVAPPLEVPAKPLAVVTDTAVTVPVEGVVQVIELVRPP